jgi:antitoxin ParD1/3/4
MATMNISLTDPLKQFVDEEVREGGYSSTSDYVRDLIRQRQRSKAEELLKQLIAEGLASGPGVAVTADTFERMRRELTEGWSVKVIEWRPGEPTQPMPRCGCTAGWAGTGSALLAELEATLQRIAVFPGSGSTRHADLAAQLPVPLRFMLVPGFERYLVYYLDLPDRVDIMRVVR